MRLLASLTNQDKAQRLAAFLNREGVATRLEATYVRDWGSEAYGTWRLDLWVLDEDQHSTALQLMESFEADPALQRQEGAPLAPLVISGPRPHAIEPDVTEPADEGQPAAPSERPAGTVTLWLLSLCIFLFVASALTTPIVKGPVPAMVPRQLLMPLVTSPLKSHFLYDWPHVYRLVDDFEARYSSQGFLAPASLPAEARQQYLQIVHTPFWEGVYPMAVALLRGQPVTVNAGAPLFEKIRQGELWRLVSPIFLHGDIFHILFNMLWLLVLGKQLEERLGVAKYLLFIALVAAFSNTAQYLMSGPNFLGFSGVLSGMLAFIWMRQRLTPWEGYHLQPQTINFVFFFIMALFALQLVSFALEVLTGNAIAPGIANTAHLSGALCGLLLSRLAFFNARP